MNRAPKPTAFRLDAPGLVVTPTEETRRAAPGIKAVQKGEPAETTERLPAVPAPARRRLPWATLFWVSAAGLVLLATGLGVANLIEDLSNRAGWLGGVGAA